MNAADQVSAVEFFPTGSPFSEAQLGFLNGLFLGRLSAAAQTTAPIQEQTALTILYASQTGTASALAKAMKKVAAGHGFSGKVAELDSVAPTDLAATHHLVIIAATTGEGEPPDNGRRFYRQLFENDVAPLPATLNYSICGLGDSSYAQFNKVARDIDDRLNDLGATRVTPLAPCDADYDVQYEAWREGVFASDPFVAAAGPTGEVVADTNGEPEPFYSKKRPFLATLLNCERLSDAQSAKTVNHIELSLASGCEQLRFEVGDALGIWPYNDLTDVQQVLELTNSPGRAIVQTKQGPMPLQLALQRVFDLTTPANIASELWEVAPAENDQLPEVLAKAQKSFTPQNLVDGLRSLQPRLYSISSSPIKHPGEVHLTVSEVHYELNGTARKGVASTFLGCRLEPGSTLGVYVQKSTHFGLPEDDETPLIMIGPGTGIAPFRSFLEEREVRQAKGWNWLFFGDQHEQADYLYKEQIRDWRGNGLLSRLSLAWSRDSPRKVYVQDLIVQDGAEFFSWLQRGAAIFVCGDASRMAVDVEAAILKVISEHGAMGKVDAEAYLDDMRRSRRYQRDVY